MTAQPVVIEVAKIGSPALDELRLALEAFDDAVVFSDAPDAGGDLLPTTFHGLGQNDNWSENIFVWH